MNPKIKILVRRIIPYNLRLTLKKKWKRFKNSFKRNVSKTTQADIRSILINDLRIQKGDNLIVSSSFGNLNAGFSPKKMILILQDIIGPEGSIVMPFYPPWKSYEWAEKQRMFDMKRTRSSMGVLTQVFSKMPGVYKSKHPTKAVVAWGKHAREIVSDHNKSVTPFFWDSPYGWLLKNPSKSLGLGLKNIPIFHALEDIILKDRVSLYYSNLIPLKIKDYDGRIDTVNVLVHDPEKVEKLIDAGDYVQSIRASSYVRVTVGFTFCYIIDNQELFKICKHEFLHENFRDKK